MKYRIFKKFTSVILAVAMVITGVNMESLHDFIKAEKSTLTTEVKGKEESKKEKEPTVIRELEDLRTADSSTYLLSNGFKRVEYYSDNIRYEKDGKYVDYNPVLKKMSTAEKNQLRKQVADSLSITKEEIGQYIYTNKSGDAKHYFPQSLRDTGILLEKNEHAIHFVPVIQEDGKEMSENEKENFNKVAKETVGQTDREVESKATEIIKTENTDIIIKETDQNKIIYEDKSRVSYKYTSNHV